MAAVGIKPLVRIADGPGIKKPFDDVEWRDGN
jgi:hypothetical protein